MRAFSLLPCVVGGFFYDDKTGVLKDFPKYINEFLALDVVMKRIFDQV